MYVVVQFYPWFKFLFSFVLNSPSYITISTEKQREINMNREHESKWFRCDGDFSALWYIHEPGFFFLSDIGGSE